MIVQTEDIKEAARLCKDGKEVAYVINEQNGYELFMFAYWQWHFKTLKAFKAIVYKREKDWLFYLLKAVSKLSLGLYVITHEIG